MLNQQACGVWPSGAWGRRAPQCFALPRPGHRLRRLLAALVLLGAGATAPAAWLHANSPYRAEFDITAAPALPDAGVALNVPICGLGQPDGSDVVAYDETGKPLPLLAMGESTQNGALVLVQPAPGAKKVFAYFGSKAKAPQNKMVFKPGLTLDVRTCPDGAFDNWKNVEKLVDRSDRVARFPVEQINLSRNPVSARSSFILVYEGYLNVAKAGAQTLMLVCPDAGYLFVDGKPLLARDGRHSPHETVRGECKAAVTLTAGPVPIKLVVAAAGSEPITVLARWLDARSKAALGPQDFVLAGRTKLAAVAARDTALPCPAFRYSLLSYMGYNNIQYTEVECATLNGQTAEWRFADGSRFDSAGFKRACVGLADLGVRVHQGRSEASGKILFPEGAPFQKTIGNGAQFKEYSSLMLQENPERLGLATAIGYRAFLSFRDLNPDLLDFSVSMLKRNDLPPQLRWDFLRDVGRIGSANKPDLAATAYQKLLDGNAPAGMWAACAREYAEFAMLRRRDFKLADRVIREMESKGGNPPAEIMSLRLLEALLKDDMDTARTRLQKLIEKVMAKSKPADAAVKRNALEARFEDLLRAGFLYDARLQLREWELVSPEDWRAGRLVLARSRLWRVHGWPDAALVELGAVIKLNPLAPNLPELELAQGEALIEAGEGQKANQVFRGIMQKYPNHPAAQRAKSFIR